MKNVSKLLALTFIFAGINLSSACAQEVMVTQDQVPQLRSNFDSSKLDKSVKDKLNQLLEYIRDNNKKKAKPLIDELAENGQINQQDRLGKTALMYLVIHDRKDLLEYLFEHYADKVDTTIKDNTEQTALDIANKKSGNSEIIEIISGTSFSNPKLIQLLNLIRDKKKQKADDFIKNQVTLEELASAKDKSGRTLLMYAAMYGDKDIMQSLFTKLQAHEDFKLDEKDNQGNTALMYAALYGNPDIIKLLREQKVNAGLQNKDGSTALKLAVERIIGNQGLVIPWPTVTPEFTMTKRALTTKGKYDDYVAVMDELTSFDVRGDDARAMKRILRDYATKDRNINKKNNAFEIDVPQE